MGINGVLIEFDEVEIVNVRSGHSSSKIRHQSFLEIYVYLKRMVSATTWQKSFKFTQIYHVICLI